MCKLVFDISTLNVQINESTYSQLCKYRQKNNHDFEQGGMLAGMFFPSENRILITNIIACKQIQATTYHLDLDVECLQKELKTIWLQSSKTINYLGDWHTHLEIIPSPSFVDYITFIKNYFTSKFDQNILLYIIIGSDMKYYCLKIFDGICFKTKELDIIKEE